MKRDFSRSRRDVLRKSLLGVGAVSVSGLIPWAQALASDDLPKLSEDDEAAQNLDYVHDATQASGRTNEDAFCYNCRYFKGSRDAEWDRCDLFPGKVVAGQGWCNVWAAK